MVKISLSIIFILLQFFALASTGCDRTFLGEWETATFKNQLISYKRVSSDNLKRNYLAADLLNEKEAVFIGITEMGHMYLVANGFRYDYKGRSFLKKATAKKNNNLLNEGVVIRVEDKHGEIAQGIDEFFLEHEGDKAISCIKGSCRALSHSGAININDKTINSILPSRFFKNYLKNGIEGSELYIVGDHSFKKTLKALENITNEQIYQVGLHGFLYAGFTIVPAAVLISKLF